MTSLSNIDCEIKRFGRLDGCKLYGSILLEDITAIPLAYLQQPNDSLGYYSSQTLAPLSEEDFEAQLRLCLTGDTILIDNKGYKQKPGLTMGNYLAPVLPIIYI